MIRKTNKMTKKTIVIYLVSTYPRYLIAVTGLRVVTDLGVRAF